MTSKVLLSGGCVLTLAKTPNFTRADVLIDAGVVAQVGPGLRARDAERVDATDTIVMPGFVDTHRHAWTSLFRNVGQHSASGKSPVPAEVADHYQPEDVYAATLIGVLGAAEAGITTVVDWSPIRPDAGFAEAALQAHADAGVRTVFVHAGRRRTEGTHAGPAIREIVARLTGAAGPMTSVALGFDVPGSADLDAIAEGWAAARELGMRIHAHAGSRSSRRGVIADLAGRGLLGEDVTLVHCVEIDDADVDAIAASGASVALVPTNEVASDLGSLPIVQQLVDRDIRPGLGVDDGCVTPGDMFAQMRATNSMQHATVFDRKLAGKAGVPRLMNTRDMIRYATTDGARVAGLGGMTGSLEPGMRADVIVLRTDRPNVFPINDPIGAVVWGMDTSNVDLVFVDGRVVMRDGVLEADVQRARELANSALERVASASGLVVGAGDGGLR